MNEHSIVMTGESPAQILAGLKTQTRRVIVPQPPEWWDRCHFLEEPMHDGVVAAVRRYGVPGDRLWVREAYEGIRGSFTTAGGRKQHIRYCADGKRRTVKTDALIAHCIHPSIHMPRWASRITLEVTDIRVERVQEISEEDAIAEGCSPDHYIGIGTDKHAAVLDFSDHWDSLHATAKRAKKNPYTSQREDCWVLYPWEDIRKQKKLKSGLVEYTVGNPWDWAIGFAKEKP